MLPETAVSTTATKVEEEIEVTVSIVTPEPTPTSAPCTPLPNGMRLTIQPGESNQILLEVMGLQADDQPILILSANASGESWRMEDIAANPVGSDGFYWNSVYVNENDSFTRLQGQIIHKRGAACFELNIPLTQPIVFEATAVPQLIVTPDTTEWLTYHNEFYNYSFNYPAEAKVMGHGVTYFPTEELPDGVTFAEYLQQLKAAYPGDICVSLQYQLGFITILPARDAGGRYADPCGITGIGAYDVFDVEETLIIDNQSYTARGTLVRERDEAATWHSEFYFLTLDDGTTIQFGSLRGTEPQFLGIKETLLQIVRSYHTSISSEKVPIESLQPTATAVKITMGDWSPDGRFLTIIESGGSNNEALFILPNTSP